MKNLRKIFITAFACATALSLSLFVACGGSGNTITAGGNKDNGVESKITIQGAADLHIPTSKTDLSDYQGSVKATDGVKTYAVTVDDSLVTYGTQGKYSLKYTYGDLSETVSVTIYGAPTISIASEYKNSYRYSEYFSGVAHGITAKDCFGNDLPVSVYKSNGAENSDGSLNVGTYTMTFVAVDKAGQAVYQDKQVTITAEEKQPQIESTYGYDVEHDDFVLELSETDYDYYIALALDGQVIPAEYAVKNDGKIIVDGDYLASTLTVDKKVSIKLLTAYGFDVADFTLTDNGIVAYDATELNKFFKKSFECLTDYEVPTIELNNLRQNVKPSYDLYYNNALVKSLNGIMNLQDQGAYTLKVELREGQTITYNFSSFFNLGFAGGRAYTQKDGITDTLKDGYNLVSYTVRQVNGSTLFTCGADGDFAEFNGKVKELSAKGKYLLDVTATPDGSSRQITQTVDFTVLDQNTTAILTEKAQIDSQAAYPNKSEYVTLEYVNGNIGGRNGAIKWEANQEVNNNNAIIRFSEEFAGVIAKGNYLTFDIYVDNPITIALNPYAAGAKYLYQSISGFNQQEVRFYDDAGERITSNVQFWATSLSDPLKSRWVTIEVKIPVDWNFDNAWYGISVATTGLYGNDVYLSNIKVSTRSYMSDWSMTLATPTLSISDAGLASWGAVEYASGYEYVINDDTPVSVGADVLSVSLKDGDTFKVRAIGDGDLYFDSEYCEAKTAKIVIHHNYGAVVNGSVFAVGSEFDYSKLNTDYTYKKFTLMKGTTTLATATATDFTEFNKVFKTLKENITYTLKIESTHATYGDIVDLLDIRFAKAGVVQILSTKADIDAGNMLAFDKTVTSLVYTTDEVGGRHASFKWSSSQEVTSNKSAIIVGKNTATETVMKKGSYIAFDFYYDKPITLASNFSGGDTYLYSATTGTAENKTWQYYDAEGNKLTSGSIWNGTYKNQWITIQIKLDNDYIFGSGYRGIFVYSSGGTLFNKNIYISNVRASTSNMFE